MNNAGISSVAMFEEITDITAFRGVMVILTPFLFLFTSHKVKLIDLHLSH